MPYLDFTTEDETTIKDKIDESLDLFREPPTSTTSSGGTAGIDYDVSDWPDTLVSGRTYYARIHTANVGPYSIDPGGGAISVTRPDGTATQALDCPANTAMGFRYDGSNLIQTFVPRLKQLTTLDSVSDTSMARFCRVTVTGQPSDCLIDVRAKYKRLGLRTNYTINVAQTSAFESSPNVSIYAYDHQPIRSDNGSVLNALAHTSVIAVITTSASDSVVDFYIRRGDSSAGLSENIDIDINSITSESGIQVEFFSGETLSSPTADVTSQAARGEVVAEESFSIGGDFSATGYAKSVRGGGGDWVTVWVPTLSHASSSTPSSASGDLPVAYRPSELQLSIRGRTNSIKELRVSTDGTIAFFYEEGNRTDTGAAAFSTYFVSD